MDLSATYLGLNLKSPLVASPSPLTRDLAGMKRLEDGGAAAVIMLSLFEEQLQADLAFRENGTSAASAPDMDRYNLGVERYLELLSSAKESLSIPVIASLNGFSDGPWIEYAGLLEQAGADAVELHLYYLAADPGQTGAAIERMYLQTVRDARGKLKVPLSVKIPPYFSSTGNIARRFAKSGADGLTLFSRFYQPDLDPDTLSSVPRLHLTTTSDLRMPLRWTSILFGRVPADIAVSGGIHTSTDVAKAILAGATVTMLCSELLDKGIRRIREIERELAQWAESHHYSSISSMRGLLSEEGIPHPDRYERVQYMKVIDSFRPDPAGISF